MGCCHVVEADDDVWDAQVDGSGGEYAEVRQHSRRVGSYNILHAKTVNDTSCSFGDGEFKPLGVTAEPEIRHRIINGQHCPFLIYHFRFTP